MAANPDLTQDKKKPVNKTAHKIFLGSYLLLALAGFAIYFLLKLEIFQFIGSYRKWGYKLSIAAGFMFLILFISKYVQGLVGKHSHHKAARYNLIRLVRLITVVLIILVFVSALYENWYTAAVSLGLGSLILGFALQTPILSFIGWLYIILRRPFSVGDRIQIDTFKGDIVEIGYLDTTLWECGGNYLTSDLPTGRLIRFPNSHVLQNAVFNYSWPRFPYVWNEIPFHVAYESDLQYVTKTLRDVASGVLGDDLSLQIDQLREMVKTSAVDDLEIKDYPYVTLRTNANTWIECTVVYLVPPKQASKIRTAILKEAVSQLLASPEKVMFPRSNNR